MTITGKHVETVLRSIQGAYGNQRATMDVLAAGANQALATAPTGLTVQGAAAFLATMAQESGSFRYLEEIKKDGPYAPYIGRTFEQITWKTNYAAFGKWCVAEGLLTDPDTFVKTPKALADIKWAWLGGVWFWQANGIWAYGNKGNFLATQQAVNLGSGRVGSTVKPAGWATRQAWYAAWLRIDAALLPEPTTAPPPPVVVTPPAVPAEPPTQPPEVDVAKVKFRGGWTCYCVATSLPVVEQAMIERGLIKHNVDIYQLGYRTDVDASAGTHAAGGNTDVGQFSDAQIECWREFGWTIQHRTKAQGFDMDHGHGWPWGCTHLSPGGRAQAAQWADQQNGLVSRGRIAGKWPVPNWRDAMNDYLKKKAEEMPTPDDLVDALLKSDKFMNAVADAVWNRDVIPNEWADKTADPTVKGSKDNPTISPKTSLRRADKALQDVQRKVTPPPPPPP